MNQGQKKAKTVFTQLAGAVFLAWFITGVNILLLAFLLYKFRISAAIISAGIVITVILANLAAGLYIGKKRKQAKFLWGLAVGSMYFLILAILSALLPMGEENLGQNAITALLLCVGSGTLGGMMA